MAIIIISGFAAATLLGWTLLVDTNKVPSAATNHKQRKCVARAITRIQAERLYR